MDVERWQVRAYRAIPPRLRLRATRLVTPNFTVGSLAFLTDDGERVLLGRPSYRRGWLPTGGFVDRGETPRDTIEREVREELGVTAELQPYHRVSFDVKRQGVTFISAGLLPRNAELVLSAELLEVRWFAFEEIPPFPPDYHEGMTEDDIAAIRALAR
jgi:ADP-ribose pyrophosphatase YjhB (NUDIX family)